MQVTGTFPELSDNVNLKGSRRKRPELPAPVVTAPAAPEPVLPVKPLPTPVLPPQSRAAAATSRTGTPPGRRAPQAAAAPKSPMQGSSNWQPRRPVAPGSASRAAAARARQRKPTGY